jgi:hypothetical protein
MDKTLLNKKLSGKDNLLKSYMLSIQAIKRSNKAIKGKMAEAIKIKKDNNKIGIIKVDIGLLYHV